MEVQITSRHGKTSQSLQDAIIAKLDKLERFCDRITSGHVILDTEHTDKVAEVVVKTHRQTLSAKARSDMVGRSVDEALAKIERQLKKINEKVKHHKGIPAKRGGEGIGA